LVNFHVDVACNTIASDVREIKFTYLLKKTFLFVLDVAAHKAHNYVKYSCRV